MGLGGRTGEEFEEEEEAERKQMQCSCMKSSKVYQKKASQEFTHTVINGKDKMGYSERKKSLIIRKHNALVGSHGWSQRPDY